MQPVASEEIAVERVGSPSTELADFDGLVSKYWPKVFRFAMASLHDPDAAGTVAQDCLLRAYRGASGFRGQSSVSTWLMQIAVNLVRDHARNRRLQFWKRTRECAVDWEDVHSRLPHTSATPELQAIAGEQTRAIWDATARLPEKQRTVFLLRFVEEMDVIEIAGATGLCEGTVKSHLFRAMEGIRRQLGRIR